MIEIEKFNNLPKKVKTRIYIIGLVTAFFIGLVGDKFYYDFDEYFYFPFFYSLLIYLLLALTIGDKIYSGYKNIKDWIIKAIFGFGLILSSIISCTYLLLTDNLYFKAFLASFIILYVGLFIIVSVFMWVYESYKNQ